MNDRALLVEQLASLLKGGEAHMGFLEAVKDFPIESANDFPPNVEYTPWHLLEHIRRTQSDILEFMVDENYKDKKWPDDYWPKKDEKADEKSWQGTVDGFIKDVAELIKIAEDPETDFSKKVPWGEGQTILRELLLTADHNAYHIGEFAILRQVMGTWKS